MGAISPKGAMPRPRSLFWLRAAATATTLGLVGVVAVRYGVGFYPDLDTDLALVRPFQYVATGAVVVFGVVMMTACMATVVVGFSGTVFHLVTGLGRALLRMVRRGFVLHLTNIVLGWLAFVAYAAPVVAAVWWSGGWSAVGFWVQAILMAPMVGLVAMFPAGILRELVNPLLRWGKRKRAGRFPTYLDPERQGLTFYLPWMLFGAWFYGDAAGSLLHPAAVRLPHPHPAVGMLIVVGVVALAYQVVSRAVLVLGDRWRPFYEREKRSHESAVTSPPVPVATPTKAVEEEPEAMWSPEPAVGWRAWRVVEGGVLHGMRQPWPTGQLESRCSACPESPGYHCTCGIYAVKERGQLPGAGFAATVVGRVELSGVVIEHERGYRAQRALILELFAPDDFIGQLKARYGCPVRVDSIESWQGKGLYG